MRAEYEDAEGNDYPVKAAGYPTRAVADWHECAEAIAQIVGELDAGRRSRRCGPGLGTGPRERHWTGVSGFYPAVCSRSEYPSVPSCAASSSADLGCPSTFSAADGTT